MSIKSANPFMDVEHITNNISDIVELRTKVVFKTDNGLIVSLPDDDTSLLQGVSFDEIMNMLHYDEIDTDVVASNSRRFLNKSIYKKLKRSIICK